MSQTDPRADVELRLPAEGAYVSVLRTTTAGLAARLDFTLDDIEDLRIAVGEASAMVLQQADPGDLHASFWFGAGQLRVRVAVDAAAAQAPDPDGFAWQVLTTLAGAAEVEIADGVFALTLTVTSSLAVGD